MVLGEAFSTSDHQRLVRTLKTLAHHDTSGWALTGGIATELHIRRRGGDTIVRPLNDIDFLVRSFEDVPGSLGRDFLPRHVHTDDPPGKTLLQCVHPDTAIRVDVFRAYGSVMDRISTIDLPIGQVGMIAWPDLVARSARLNWDLAGNRPLAPKYARDFLRLLEVAVPDEIEPVWREHRKTGSPQSFAETARELRRLIESRADLLIPPVYSTDVNEVCSRCRDTAELRLTEPAKILSLLGYC